jgi:biopolymer transport protein ExbD
MKIHSPLQHKKARIEIIPLIDIMFFLLAVMMMVSLNMIQMKGIKLNLPTAATATKENKSNFTTVSVSSTGEVFLDKQLIERKALLAELQKRKAAEADLRVYVQADADAVHGDVVAVLDRIRAAGIQKVGFQTKAEEKVALPSGETPPVTPPAAIAVEPAAPAAPAPQPANP